MVINLTSFQLGQVLFFVYNFSRGGSYSISRIAVGAVQFPLVPDGGAACDLYVHLHQDAVPYHSRAADWVISQIYAALIC